MIGFTPNKEQSRLLTEVKEIMEGEVSPLLLEIDRRGDDTFDWRLVKVAARHNLVAPTVPKKYGGRGLSYLTTALIMEETAAASPSLVAIIATVIHAVTPVILAGTEEQKEQYLPPLTSGQPNLAAFALTEPGGGSDLEHMKTTALKQGESFIINGVKDFVINGAVSRFIALCARCQGVPGIGGLEFFLVPPDQVKVTEVRHKMGLRGAHTVQLKFDNTELPAEAMLGQSGNGYLLLTQTLDYGRAIVGALEVGIARAAFQIALSHAHERKQFNRPLITNQGISFALAEMATAIDSARLLAWRACAMIDNGIDCSREASMAKLYASEVAHMVSSRTVEILGARGYTTEHPGNIIYRDAKAGSIVEGTNNVQKMVIASLL